MRCPDCIGFDPDCDTCVGTGHICGICHKPLFMCCCFEAEQAWGSLDNDQRHRAAFDFANRGLATVEYVRADFDDERDDSYYDSKD